MTTTPMVKPLYTAAEVVDILDNHAEDFRVACAREMLRMLHTEPLLSVDTGLLPDYDELRPDLQMALKRVAFGFIQLVTPATPHQRR